MKYDDDLRIQKNEHMRRYAEAKQAGDLYWRLYAIHAERLMKQDHPDMTSKERRNAFKTLLGETNIHKKLTDMVEADLAGL